MEITGATACVIKMPSNPTTIFVSFNVRLMDPKPLFEIKCRAYILLFTITTFFTTYNPSLPNMDTLVKKYLPLLHSDENLKELFLLVLLIPYTDVTRILKN